MNSYTKVSPGPMGHCATIAEPSSKVEFTLNKPWKWIDVVSFPSKLTALITIVSPMFATTGGKGQTPLMPTKGRVKPSGAALTQPMFQL